jgi:hypothetical protein
MKKLEIVFSTRVTEPPNKLSLPGSRSCFIGIAVVIKVIAVAAIGIPCPFVVPYFAPL